MSEGRSDKRAAGRASRTQRHAAKADEKRRRAASGRTRPAAPRVTFPVTR